MMKSEEWSNACAIVDSKPWKARCWMEVDLGWRMELEERCCRWRWGSRLRGGHMGWECEWTCTVDEGDAENKEASNSPNRSSLVKECSPSKTHIKTVGWLLAAVEKI